jgi:hypothetical protein
MPIGYSSDVAIATNSLGDLHVCSLDDPGGGLWHTIRKADGTWPFPFGDVFAQNGRIIGGPNPPGRFNSVHIAANVQGDLHVVCGVGQGVWHTMRKADGTWPYAFSYVGPNPRIYFFDLAIATNVQGDLHVCGAGGGSLWHTIRKADGTWPYAFGDVLAQTGLPNLSNYALGDFAYPFPNVAIATNSLGDLHVCAIPDQPDGGLYHTIRKADGTWPFPFGDVLAQTGPIGPNLRPGNHVAVATNAQGDLHVCMSDHDGSTFWHTIRKADGTWPYAFGDVLAQTGRPNVGDDPIFADVAIATNALGDLHVCFPQGDLWHTIRKADGTWPFRFGDVNAQVPA